MGLFVGIHFSSPPLTASTFFDGPHRLGASRIAPHVVTPPAAVAQYSTLKKGFVYCLLEGGDSVPTQAWPGLVSLTISCLFPCTLQEEQNPRGK